jgi:excisionase family DNA binding protein
MATSTDHELLTIAEAADLLRVDRSTIRRWIASGRLNADRYGARSIRIPRTELLRGSAAPSNDPNGELHPPTAAFPHDIPESMDDATRSHLMQAIARSRRRRATEHKDAAVTDTAPPAWVLINESRDERSSRSTQ